MSLFRMFAIAGIALAAAACGGVPKDMTVAEYCANPKKGGEAICKVNVEIDGQKRALADTSMSLTEARQVADNALLAAQRAQASIDQNASRTDLLNCETRTLSKTNEGSCSPGYKLVSCTQSRYTYRAGGMSIMRSIDDQSCRFHDKILEMKVRCCMAGGSALPTEEAAQPATPVEPGRPSDVSSLRPVSTPG